MRRILIAVVLVAAWWGAPVLAQGTTAAVEGVVVDRTGGGLADVRVRVADANTGFSREGTTDARGYFTVVGVPVEGTYEVRFARPGFSSVVRTAVTLSPNKPTRLDVMLDLSSVQAVVVGSTEPDALDRTHAMISDVIPAVFIENLPVLGRGFLPLVSLAAGFTGHADYPNPLGQQYWAHTVVVDSASHFSKWRTAPRAFGSGYSLDAIQQVHVLTSLFSPEFGGALGSVTTATTRAGTNEWRGSVQLFVRHAALDARPAFAASTPPGHTLLAGGTVGGPLVANRTHLFASVDTRHVRDTNVVSSPVAAGVFVPDTSDEQLLLGRLDHRWSDRQTLTVRANTQRFRWSQEPGGLVLPGSGTRYRTDVANLLVTGATTLSSRSVNEVRVQGSRYVDVRTDLQPTVFVSRAGYSIEGGRLGAGGFGADPEGTLEAADTWSLLSDRHAWRAGGGTTLVRAHNVSFPDARGGYFFAGAPAQYPAPFLFVQSFASTPGAGTADPRSAAAFAFLQDDWHVGTGLTLNLGVRYDIERVWAVQTVHVPVDRNNVQPRAGFAWDMGGGGRTVVRGGVGVFTQQQLLYPINRGQLEGPDGVMTVSLSSASPVMPRFPETLSSAVLGANGPPRDIVRVSSTLHNPYAVQGAIGVQRTVGGMVVSADVIHLRGRDLLSLLDVNAPASLQKPAVRTVAQADATRPLVPAPSTYREIVTLGNEGRSWYRALQVRASRYRGPVNLVASYTLARAENLADYELPEDSRNLPAEKGPASTDVRHAATSGATWQLPGCGPATRGWSLAALLVARSGRPYTMTWGDDRTGTTQNDARPDGRNTRRTGPYRTVDVAATRRLHAQGFDIDARLEIFNVFNAVNYDAYVGALLSPLFGQPVSAFPARRVQLAVTTRF